MVPFYLNKIALALKARLKKENDKSTAEKKHIPESRCDEIVDPRACICPVLLMNVVVRRVWVLLNLLLLRHATLIYRIRPTHIQSMERVNM